MTGRSKKRLVRTFIRQRRKGLWRIFEAAIALFCLLVTHQSVWVYFQDLSARLRQSYPNPTVWITPASPTEPVDPQIYPKPSFQVGQARLALRGFAPPNKPVNLIINGIAAGSDFSYDGKLNFYDVKLRRGANEITAYLWDPARQASLSTNEISSPQIIYYQPAQLLPPRFLGMLLDEDGRVVVLGMADPTSRVFIHDERHPDSMAVWVDPAGFFQYTLAQAPQTPVRLHAVMSASSPEQVGQSLQESILISAEALQSYGRLALGRRITLTIWEDQRYELQAQARLPENTALREWVEQDLINAEEFAEEFLGIRLVPWRVATETKRQDFPKITEDGITLKISGDIPETGQWLEFSRANALNQFPLASSDDTLRVELLAAQHAKLLHDPDASSELDSSQTYVWYGGALRKFSDNRLLDIRNSAVPALHVSGAPSPDEPRGLVPQLTYLQNLIPRKVAHILEALLSAIPFLWLLWILRSRAGEERTGFHQMLYAVTMTFLIFHLALLCLPVFSVSLGFVAPLLSLFSVEDDVVQTVTAVGQVYPFFAIGIMLLFRPLYYAYLQRRGAPTWRKRVIKQLQRWLVFWPLAVIVPAALFYILVRMRQETSSVRFDSSLFDNFLLGAGLFGIVGMLTFWFFLYWFIRIGLGRSVSAGTSIKVSWAMLLLPLVPIIIEAGARFLRHLITEQFQTYPFFIPPRLDSFVWSLIITAVGAILFYQIANLSLRLSQHSASLRFWRSAKIWWLVPLFIMISLPMRYLAGAERAASDAGDLQLLASRIDMLLPYALLIGLLSFLRKSNPHDRFDLQAEAISIGTILFAYYLTGRTANLLFVPFPLLVGWLIFKRWVLVSPATAGASAASLSASELVRRLLDCKQARRLSDNLRNSLEKKYTQGDLALADMQKKIAESQEHLVKTQAALPAGEMAAKRQIFGHGPEPGPWANAKVAVKYGIVLSIPFQISTLGNIFQNQQFENYPLLQFLGSLLFAASSWILMAFVFGYFFHMIRGRDGFAKAVVFAIALLVPTIPQRLIFSQPLLQQGHLIQIVQIFAYVLLLALIAFDLRTLRKLGFSWRELLTVHGFTTITAYSSSILLATLASLSGKDLIPLAKNFIGWLIGIQTGP